MAIQANFSDRSSQTITSGYTTNPSTDTPLTTDVDKVTVTYNGKTAEFTISVNEAQVPGLTYTLNESQTGVLVKWDKTTVLPEELKIPSVTTLDNKDYKVVGLQEAAFEDNTIIKTVTIPKTISKISESAFDSCTNLKKINLPKTIITIEERAFFGCESLEDIELPDELERVSSLAFYGCKDTLFVKEELSTTSTIQQYVKYLKKDQKSTNDHFVAIDISKPPHENNVEYSFSIHKDTEIIADDFIAQLSYYSDIEFYTIKQIDFSQCSNWRTIGDYGFCDTYKFKIDLTSLVIPSTVKYIGKKAFYNYIQELKSETAPIKSITLNEGLEVIGESAFEYSNISSLTIPTTVKSIGKTAFKNCNSLASVKFSDESKTWIQTGGTSTIVITNQTNNATNLKNCVESSTDNWGFTGIEVKNS